MANSKKRCKQCKTYVQANDGVILPGGFFCTVDHAIVFANRKASEAKKKTIKQDARKARRNPKAEALKVAQLLARISNADDNGYCTCVTCGYKGLYNEYFDGGHYIAKGGSSYWMLDPRNIHPQCKSCNGHGMQYGNKESEYALWMVDKYGREFVDHMHATKSKIIKRSSKDYDDFIARAKAEIDIHKKRISIAT